MGLDLIVRPRRGSDPALGMIRQSLCRLAHRIDRQLKQTSDSPTLEDR
jgi:hypothetical protein